MSYLKRYREEAAKGRYVVRWRAAAFERHCEQLCKELASRNPGMEVSKDDWGMGQQASSLTDS